MVEKIVENWQTITAILLIVGIDIIPAIKVSPIRWALKKLGNLLHTDIKEDIKQLSSRIDKIQEDNDLKDVRDIKNKLCTYQSLLLEYGALTQDQYNRCYELMDAYREYQDKYNTPHDKKINGHMDAAMEFINRHYVSGHILKGDVENEK